VLDAVTRRITELGDSNAVDAATGDVIDHLVDAWLAQWREQLVQRHQARRSALGGEIAEARNRVAAASAAAEATSAAWHAALGRGGSPSPHSLTTGPKQVTNGARTASPH
jgi:hypothetical protein